MPDQPATMAAEIEAIRVAYAALNAGDVDGFCSLFAPDIERYEFLGTPRAGTFLGLPAVLEHVAKARSTWAEGGCYPQRFEVAGDKVLVFVHVRVRLKGQTDWGEGDIADGFIFRNGKATFFRTFAEEHEGLAWMAAKE